jgi:hypothetical protein
MGGWNGTGRCLGLGELNIERKRPADQRNLESVKLGRCSGDGRAVFHMRFTLLKYRLSGGPNDFIVENQSGVWGKFWNQLPPINPLLYVHLHLGPYIII